MSILTDIQSKYPFLTCLKSNDIEYVGIIINFDSSIASIYDISTIRSSEETQFFLEMGEIWWSESNRKIPINIFLKNEMQLFKYVIKTVNSKDVEILFGPTVNLSEIAEKRVKRKSIQLVRIPKRNDR